jgi:AcrR family transcriptional regulator
VHSLRGDAKGNRDRILAAALDVFVEQGAGAPLDEIARRAGTGIATLYRRFPNRQALMLAVVLDALERTIDSARRAARESPDAFDALTHYMHAALDTRIAAVIPALLAELDLDDAELTSARRRGSRAVSDLVRSAHKAGTLDPEVSSGDIGMLIVRLSRPLPGFTDPTLDRDLAHRHLDQLIHGLHRDAAHTSRSPTNVSGPSLTLGQLGSLRRRPSAKPSAAASRAGTASVLVAPLTIKTAKGADD